LYPLHHACLAARDLQKFGQVAAPNPKVVGAHTPNFKPIFYCSSLKIVGGTPVPNGVCLRKPWSFSSACKNFSRQRPLGAEIWSSEKVDLGGSESTSRSLLLVDQSSPTFFAERGRNRSRSSAFSILDIYIRSGDISDRTLKWSKTDPNFARFWPPTFLGEGPPNFWT